MEVLREQKMREKKREQKKGTKKKDYAFSTQQKTFAQRCMITFCTKKMKSQ